MNDSDNFKPGTFIKRLGMIMDRDDRHDHKTDIQGYREHDEDAFVEKLHGKIPLLAYRAW